MTNNVGYKRPPAHTRFKKGKSGNPKGRPKRSRSFADEIYDLLNERVEIVIDGVPRRQSRRRLLAIRLLSKALGGDPQSARLVNALDGAVSNGTGDRPETFSETDDEILDRYLRKVAKKAGILS